MSQHKIKEAKKAALDRKLDEALEESFPGSDPVALSEPALPEPTPADEKSTGASRERRSSRTRR